MNVSYSYAVCVYELYRIQQLAANDWQLSAMECTTESLNICHLAM